jgi:hypothetical protein
MQYLKFSIVVFGIGLFFYSCDPCHNLDCANSNYFGQFRIARATDGVDLVFGPAHIYDKTKIKFYSLNGTDTTFFDYQTIKFPGTGYDSILHVRFFPENNTAYMNLGNGDIDTFTITYNTYYSRCCGTITEITRFRFNNSVDIPGSQGTQEIRK